MQNKKQGGNRPKNVKNKRPVRFEDLLEDDRFDDEDADSVTDDTLQFLSLDDEMIASYQETHGAPKASKVSRSTTKASKGSHDTAKASRTSGGTARTSGTSRSTKSSRADYAAVKSSGTGSSKKSSKNIRYAKDYDAYEDEAYDEDERYYEDERYEDEAYYEDERYEDEAYYEDERYEDEEDYEDEAYYEDERYEDEEDYEDEAYYEDDRYEDEEDYEDEAYYEDDDYEDDDYEDEDDDDYDDDDDDGVIARFRDFLSEMSSLDMVVAMLGILVVAGAIVTGTLYFNAKSMEKQVATFAEVGGQMEGVSVIGESGLLAVSESAKLGNMVDNDFDESDLNWGEGREDEEEEDENKEVEVELRLTSIQSDLKIKFANKSSGRLIGGVPFVVEVSGGGKTYDLKDDDKDGIIYQTGVSAGSYSVKIKPLEGEAYQKYKLQSSASTVEVTDKIAYKKVDVTDEVKKESEINVSKEEAAQQNTVVESTLKDTVEWVESTKTPVGGEKDSYEEVPKDKIVDPWVVAGGYRKLVEGDPDNTEESEGGEATEPGTSDENEKIEVSLNRTSLELKVGDHESLSVSGGDSSKYSVEWSTDDSSVATVSGGTVTAEGSGSTTVRAKVSAKGDDVTVTPSELKCSVTVKEEEPSKKKGTVSLSETSLTVEIGASKSLSVSGTNGINYTVDWSSSNDSVVSVSSGGTITANKAGSATITAQVNADSDSEIEGSSKLTCSVEVKDKPNKKGTVSLNETKMEVNVGGTKPLSVSGTNGISYTVKWSSSNESVATVSGGGTVTARKTGTATITAEVKADSGSEIEGSNKLTCAVTVTENKKEVELKLSKTELQLAIGGKETLKLTDGSGNAYEATWRSEDDSVAKVFDDGQVKGLKEGTTTVKAKVKDVSGVTFKNSSFSCKVIISNKNYKKVTISGKQEVGIGQSLTLTAKSDPEGAEIVWSSEDEKKAKVDSKGVVTGVAEGKVKIRAACKANKDIYGVLEITVKKSVIDPATKLKDKDGNQLYYKKKSTGEFIEATYQDYKERSTFYKKVKVASEYKYTGWQTIDGFVYFFGKDNQYVTGDQVILGAKYSFGSDGKLSKGSGSMGIDVSKHNGNIDWNAVKNSGVSYVIIRCGYRGYSTGVLVEDPMFRSNIKGAKAAGLKVGAYFFSQAVNEVEAVEEASMAIDLVKGYGLDYPLFLDVEGSGGRGDAIGRDTRTAVCKTFCQTVQNSGISSGIYANKTWFNEKINTGSLTSYKIWLAQYASAPTYTATRYDMWQYSSKGKVSGISGNVDMNISYMN